VGLARPYASAVHGLAPTIERSLTAAVVTHRWTPPAFDVLEPWVDARRRLRRRLRDLGRPGRGTTIVRSDVRKCYPSIGIAAVAAAMPARDPRTAVLLRTLARIQARGIHGLPVGPPASAIVANAVLGRGDRAIAASGARHLRWVDDVLIVADGPREARRALQAWRRALDEAGLEANPAKTSFDVDPRELPPWMGSAWSPAFDVR
jgi:hypothetical protein